jgi:phage shock protein A
MLDTDLEGLSPTDAGEYVLAFITTLKQTEKDLVKATEDVELWRRRVALAQEKGEPALAAQAQARLSELEARQTSLQAEVLDLKQKVSILKEKLVKIRMMGTRTVDVDLLLAQLQMIVGEKDTLAISFKEQEANVKLDELKKKMSGGGSPQGGPS